MKNQKGFIQIPLLIAIIVGVLVLGGASYVGIKQYQNHKAEIAQNKIATENNQVNNTPELSEVEKLRQEVEALKKQQNQISNKPQPKQVDCASVSLSTEEVQEMVNKANQVNKEAGGFDTNSLKKVLFALEAAYKTNKAPSCKSYFDKEVRDKELALGGSQPNENPSTVSVADFAKYVVRVICTDGNRDNPLLSSGSGTIFGLNRFVITNSHVVEGAVLCSIGLTDDIKRPPTRWYEATVASNITSLDIATLQPSNPLPSDASTVAYNLCNPNNINLGDPVIIIGYPSVGGNTITVTEGVVSGFDGLIVKTSAKIEHGNSGGGAFLKNENCWFGIPTAVAQGELESLGFIVNYSLIHQKANE